MIESAERLLASENPAPGEKGVVASRHVDTFGQRLRAKAARLLITKELAGVLTKVPVGKPVTGNVVSSYRKSGLIVHIVNKIALANDEVWEDRTVPADLSYELFENVATIFRLPLDAPPPPTSDRDSFIEYCSKVGVQSDTRHIVFLCGDEVRPFTILRDADIFYGSAVIPPQPDAPRLDASHLLLREKSVALVGCGSLGSKIGVTLARSGVGSFLLIDDDVMMPNNLVRNDLDWRDVGAHKADSVARRIQYVNPAVVTRTRKIQLAGQESGESADTALNAITQCDLIIDATANPNVLNLLSAVVNAAARPIVWAEVFGGGIGGLIARYRPGREPLPQYMRLAIENWFAEKDASPVRATRDYATGTKVAPLIADDADVTSIAGPATRMAIDLLVGRDPSLFPHSVYAIGLGVGSVFRQPFETHPIDLGETPVAKGAVTLSDEERTAELAGILALFAKK
jgi:molybdopterin/thiamine biosynthesis adenylyltransferase